MEVQTAPGLPHQPLRELHAAGLIFREQSLDVRYLDRCQDQRHLALRQLGEIGLVDEAKVKTNAVARHGSVEGGIAVEEIHSEAELRSIEFGGCGDVAHEQ